MGINPKTEFLDGGDARQPLLDTQPGALQASTSGPSAPPLPTSTISTPLLSNEYPDPVKPGAGGAGPSYLGGGGAYPGMPPPDRSGDYQSVPGYPAYPPPVIDYPPGAGYAAQQYMGSPLVQVSTRTIILAPLTDASVVVTCPHCGYRGATIVDKESGFCTWLSSFTLCFLGCCVLSLLPFCCSSTKDIVHRCANCGTILGRRRP